MNLVDQCVQGEGLVQINVEIKIDSGLKKINIVDVLKPADDLVSEDEEETGNQDTVTRYTNKSPVNAFLYTFYIFPGGLCVQSSGRNKKS